VNIVYKQLWMANKGWSSSFGVGLKISLPYKISLLQNVTKGLGLGQILWINDLN
jgi:ATP-dependent phosphoenolpyruvate carboxykinase